MRGTTHEIGRSGWAIRDMEPGDIPDGLRLCRAASWNQQAEDWQALLAQGAFRVAVRHDRVVGCAGAVVYARSLAWVAMVLVDPPQRRQGIAASLVQDVLERLKHVAVVGLDATPAGATVYAPLGFVERRSLVRMERAARAGRNETPVSVRRTRDADLDAIGRRDLAVFGADRSRLLHWARRQAPEYAWIRDGGADAPLGYVFGRHGHRTEHVGPLVAGDEDAALALLAAAVATSPASAFSIDAPDRPTWLARLRALGFEAQRPFSRMILGGVAPPGDWSVTYGVFGPELG